MQWEYPHFQPKGTNENRGKTNTRPGFIYVIMEFFIGSTNIIFWGVTMTKCFYNVSKHLYLCSHCFCDGRTKVCFPDGSQVVLLWWYNNQLNSYLPFRVSRDYNKLIYLQGSRTVVAFPLLECVITGINGLFDWFLFFFSCGDGHHSRVSSRIITTGLSDRYDLH